MRWIVLAVIIQGFVVASIAGYSRAKALSRESLLQSTIRELRISSGQVEDTIDRLEIQVDLIISDDKRWYGYITMIGGITALLGLLGLMTMAMMRNKSSNQRLKATNNPRDG